MNRNCGPGRPNRYGNVAGFTRVNRRGYRRLDEDYRRMRMYYRKRCQHTWWYILLCKIVKFILKVLHFLAMAFLNLLFLIRDFVRIFFKVAELITLIPLQILAAIGYFVARHTSKCNRYRCISLRPFLASYRLCGLFTHANVDDHHRLIARPDFPFRRRAHHRIPRQPSIVVKHTGSVSHPPPQTILPIPYAAPPPVQPAPIIIGAPPAAPVAYNYTNTVAPSMNQNSFNYMPALTENYTCPRAAGMAPPPPDDRHMIRWPRSRKRMIDVAPPPSSVHRRTNSYQHRGAVVPYGSVAGRGSIRAGGPYAARRFDDLRIAHVIRRDGEQRFWFRRSHRFMHLRKFRLRHRRAKQTKDSAAGSV